MYQDDLEFCAKIKKFDRIRIEDNELSEVVLVGIVARFFRCFGRNEAQFSLVS